MHKREITCSECHKKFIITVQANQHSQIVSAMCPNCCAEIQVTVTIVFSPVETIKKGTNK